MQQRAIRAEALERLLEFGREAFDHRGGVVLYFDKAARRRLARVVPGAKDLERLARYNALLSLWEEKSRSEPIARQQPERGTTAFLKHRESHGS